MDITFTCRNFQSQMISFLNEEILVEVCMNRAGDLRLYVTVVDHEKLTWEDL